MLDAALRNRTEWAQGAGALLMRRPEDTVAWHRASLELEPRLAAFGKLLADDPSIQFCLHAARRHLGDFETPRQWFADFVRRQPPGPWRDAAAAELWLAERRGPAPKPLALCRVCDTKPFLDGKLDDACWKGVEPLVLRDATRFGKEGKQDPTALEKGYETRVWLTYDREFLYVAVRCERPEDRYVAPAKKRPRDADLRGHDRVSLLLDLDRDYSTCFHLQVDERGCVREDCWGDASWDPRWYVAVHSEPGAWQVEAAIPLVALTGDAITPGRTWACNVVRVLPGRGVVAWSLPAGVPEKDPRLEGMGLLMFRPDPRQEVRSQPAAPRMGRVQ